MVSLEGAAHEDTLVRTVIGALAARQIENAHANAAGMLALQFGQSCFCALSPLRQRAGACTRKRWNRKQAAGKRVPARYRRGHRSLRLGNVVPFAPHVAYCA